jgi:hypothetical protein
MIAGVAEQLLPALPHIGNRELPGLKHVLHHSGALAAIIAQFIISHKGKSGIMTGPIIRFKGNIDHGYGRR